MPCHCSSTDCNLEDPSGPCYSPGALSLFSYIKCDYISALNEKVRGSARAIFRPHSQRLRLNPYLESDDDDPQVIIRVPLSQSVQLSFISIGMLQPGSSYFVRIFTDRSSPSSLDFSNIWSLAPVQEFALIDLPSMISTYPLQPFKFMDTSELTLHICTTEHTKENPFLSSRSSLMIFYIGLYGKTSDLRRDPIISVYEARPTLADHPCVERKPYDIKDSVI